MDDVHEVTDKYLGAVDPDNFDVVQDFSGPFPVEVITRMAGVPEEYRQQLRHWIDTHTDQVIIIVSLILGFWLVGNSIYYLIT